MYFHLSKQKDVTLLHPQIPHGAVEINEDVKTRRICLAERITNCLASLQTGNTEYNVYVYTDDESKIYHPTTKEVSDCEITHEVWVKDIAIVRPIGRIACENEDWCDNGFHHYPYHFIDYCDTYKNFKIRLYLYDGKRTLQLVDDKNNVLAYFKETGPAVEKRYNLTFVGDRFYSLSDEDKLELLKRLEIGYRCLNG